MVQRNFQRFSHYLYSRSEILIFINIKCKIWMMSLIYFIIKTKQAQSRLPLIKNKVTTKDQKVANLLNQLLNQLNNNKKQYP